MAEPAHEAQDKSIKDRKQQLYERDASPVLVGSGKSFKEFLRDTPPNPLSAGMKAALFAAGAVVAVLLILALMRVAGGPKKPVKATLVSNPVITVAA